jgi:hypothetical protein
MDFSFDSVNRFLQEVSGAKADRREAVNKGMAPLLDDPSTFIMAPDAANLLDGALEKYGDEALKQTAIVALGKWVVCHEEWLEQHIMNESAPEAALTAADMTKIAQAIRLIEDVGSFGGDEDYRKAVKKQINQAVLEKLEEEGRSPEDVFSPYDDPLF